jgi:putative addiction module component (TIGR02574 family)
VISPVHELEAAALALPLEERARLAERLLSSLDENAEDVEAAWVVEVRDRMAQFRSGTLTALPAEEVMADARKRATRR